jgi:prophage regulatory protein
MNETLLRLRDVESRTGLRRSHIYLLAARGQFPRPLKLGNRASAWVEREVTGWINARIRASGRQVSDSTEQVA